MQLRPIPPATGGLLLKQAAASGSAQLGPLLCQVLTLTGDAAVATAP